MSLGTALFLAVALLLSAPVVALLQVGGVRRRWPLVRRIAFASAAMAALVQTHAAAGAELRGGLPGAIAGLGSIPVYLVVGSEDGSLARAIARLALFACVAAAWCAPLLALGLAAGFAALPRPTLRLRRALALLLLAPGTLLLAGAGGLAALAPAAVDAAAPARGGLELWTEWATRMPWAPWPLLLVALAGAMGALFPTSADADPADAPLPEPSGWRW